VQSAAADALAAGSLAAGSLAAGALAEGAVLVPLSEQAAKTNAELNKSAAIRRVVMCSSSKV